MFTAALRLLLVGSALAAGSGRATETGARPAEEPTVTEEPVIVSLPRNEAAADPTGSATVIDAQRYAGESKGLAELVATAPGVAVNAYGGLGRLATASIRGSTADQVQVLLDGLPLAGAAGGGVDLSTIPVHWISRIEVVRGAEAAHYGAGAMAGVINIVTRPVEPGTWAVETRAGSFNTLGLNADGALGGQRWNAMVAGTVEGTGGRFPYAFDPQPAIADSPLVPARRDNNQARAGGAFAKIRGELGRGTLDGMAGFSGGNRGLPGHPYARTPADRQEDSRAAAMLRYATPGPGDTRLAIQAGGRYDRLDLALARLGAPTRQRALSASTTARLGWDTGPAAWLATATAGGERLEGTGTAGAGGAAGEAGGGPGRAGPLTRPELAGALSQEWNLGRLQLAPAVRWERVGDHPGVSGKAGARVAIAGPLAARASVGRSFRAPSFAELHLEQGALQPNPGLRPESGWSADAALVADGRLGWASLGAFGALHRDLIGYELASFQTLKPFNDGRALMRGLEAELATATLAGVDASVAYTLLETRSLRGTPATVGNELPHRSRHRGYARLGWSWEPIGAHLEGHYLGRQWQDRENLTAIPPTWLLHAGASWKAWKVPVVELHLEVKNLLDRRDLQDGFGYPLPGRMLLASVRVASAGDAAIAQSKRPK
jgi:iron complex outermembrane receptor protein